MPLDTGAATEAVLFDLGGTLDAEGVAWKERFFRIVKESVPALMPEAFDRAFYAADDALVGAIPNTLGFRATVERLAEGLALRLGYAHLGPAVASRFAAESESVLASRLPLLSSLAARYRLGVVSNFYGNLRRVLSDVKLLPLFAVAVDSAEVGWSKPDARIFHAALGPLGVPPGRAVFVGDSQARDMAGAKGIGMRHVWLHPGRNGGEPCCARDVVIRALGELPGALS